MAKNKILNQFNFDPAKNIKAEVNKKPSETVPDMGMTVREIINRYTRGLAVSQYKPIWYEEDKIDEFEGQFDHLTPQERLDLAADIRKQISDYQAGIKADLEKQQEERAKLAALKKAKEYKETNPNAGKEPRGGDDTNE